MQIHMGRSFAIWIGNSTSAPDLKNKNGLRSRRTSARTVKSFCFGNYSLAHPIHNFTFFVGLESVSEILTTEANWRSFSNLRSKSTKGRFSRVSLKNYPEWFLWCGETDFSSPFFRKESGGPKLGNVKPAPSCLWSAPRSGRWQNPFFYVYFIFLHDKLTVRLPSLLFFSLSLQSINSVSSSYVIFISQNATWHRAATRRSALVLQQTSLCVRRLPIFNDQCSGDVIQLSPLTHETLLSGLLQEF